MLLRANYAFHPFRLETIWVPVYRASVLPLRYVALPEGISLAENDTPDASLSHGAVALKLHMERSAFDGSLSYFNGYNPKPGLCAEQHGDAVNIVPTAYRMHVAGADFSTVRGAYGIRGEIAYRHSHKDHKDAVHIPNPDLFYIFGVDRTYGDFSLILQYMGRYVWDFERLAASENDRTHLVHELELYNRMFFSQLDEVTHGITFRPSWSLFHETMTIDMLGSYNLTTEEVYLKPKMSYDIVDDLSVTVGGEVYSGPDETLYGLLDSRLSALFLELKTSY